jgi:enolase
MNRYSIAQIRALEILDSRGRPTVEVEVRLAGGTVAAAQVPSGASTGLTEAHELRDGDARRYGGLGVLHACRHVEEVFAPALEGKDVREQQAIDAALCALDGTPNKQGLGANAILGISCAVARAAAQEEGVPLWEYLAEERKPRLPMPMVNILSGGLHTIGGIEVQDFLAIPKAATSFRQAMEWIVAIHRGARAELQARGIPLQGVADEGGWGPRLKSNEEALEILVRAIERAELVPGEQVTIALDIAASHFHRDGMYDLASEGHVLNAGGLVDLLEEWCKRYPVTSIEDGLDQSDWENWPRLTERLGKRAQIVGDDFLTTNRERVDRAIAAGAANAVLVKMNQIGTLTETFDVIDRARQAGWKAVVSARSGETEDSFLADLAVASGMGQIKVGSITRSERLAKYNRLLALEREGLSW